MERDKLGLKQPTDKHPFKGMQDPRIETVDPNLLFRLRVSASLAEAGTPGQNVDKAINIIFDAANERQREIGARSQLKG